MDMYQLKQIPLEAQIRKYLRRIQFGKNIFCPECRIRFSLTSHTWLADMKLPLQQWWPVLHSRDIHKKFEFEHTSEIEGMFVIMRTFIRRMYHHVEAEQMPKYVREFCFRFSSPEMFENPLYYAEKTLTLVPTR